MTVAELIAELKTIKDKNLKVTFEFYDNDTEDFITSDIEYLLEEDDKIILRG